MSKINVLHIIDTLSVGGAEKLLVGIVNGLDNVNNHVIYLGGCDTLAGSFRNDCRLSKLNFKSRFDIPGCVLRLKKYIRENNIDVVHTHLFMSTFIARLAVPKHVQLFTTIHSLPSKNYFAKSKVVKWLDKISYRKHHHVIAICDEVYKDYNSCTKITGPHTVLYNYVENVYHRPNFKKMSFNGTFRMVAVGNLKEAKNYPFLVEAFKAMPKNVHLDIYGSGSQQQMLQSEIEKHNLNIQLCGVRDDIQNVLPQYDAFIMASVFEGQPLSLLEAMASGLPAILSDIPVLREVTASNAVFFDLKHTDDLVQKVTAIANHQFDLDPYAEANFRRIKQIASKDMYMSRLSNLYYTAVVQKQARKYPEPFMAPFGMARANAS